MKIKGFKGFKAFVQYCIQDKMIGYDLKASLKWWKQNLNYSESGSTLSYWYTQWNGVHKF